MVLIKYKPELNQKIKYVYYSHPKPWKLSAGNIIGEELDGGEIRVRFSLSKLDAVSSEDWDPESKSVILEVIDNDNRVVFESLVPVKGPFIQGVIGLRQ